MPLPRFVPSAPPRPYAAPPPALQPDAAHTTLAWVTGAMAIMALPLVITAGFMIAPMALMWAARKSTNG